MCQKLYRPLQSEVRREAFKALWVFLFEPPHGFIFAGIPSQQIAQELACRTNKYTKVAECITLSSFYLACEQCRLKSQTFHSLSQKKKNKKKKKIPVRIQRKTIEPWQFVFHWRSKPSFLKRLVRPPLHIHQRLLCFPIPLQSKTWRLVMRHTKFTFSFITFLVTESNPGGILFSATAMHVERTQLSTANTAVR